MPLIDLKTDLKSLKYGQDRLGGGDSGEPYIKNDINNPTNILGVDDGFIRGGFVGAVGSSLTDTLRIGKFFTNAPQGPLFLAKQVGLQLSNPRLEVKKITGVGGLLNAFLTGNLGSFTNGLLAPTRLYNLGINTIAQIPVNAFGGHFSRHGLLPVQADDTKYESVVTDNNKPEVNNNRLLGLVSKFTLGNKPVERDNSTSIISNFINRINSLTGLNIPNSKPTDTIIDSYIGGPGSAYGIGNTVINRTTFTADKDAISRLTILTNNKAGKAYNTDGNIGILDYNRELGKGPKAISNYSTDIDTDRQTILSSLNKKAFNNSSRPTVLNRIPGTNIVESTDATLSSVTVTSVKNNDYSDYARIIESKNLREKTYTLDGNPVNAFGIYGDAAKYNTEILPDSNKKVIYVNGYNEVVTINKNWNKATRELRVGSSRKDSINLTPLFYTTAGSFDAATISIPAAGIKDQTVNDLVKFQIQAVDTEDITKSVWMVFRAYLGEISDDVNASWTDISYAGRGDKFYIYDSFSRKMSVTFKVAALSYGEMKPMYQKLNYLMGNLMPDYGIGHVLRGPLVRMTIGNYIDGQLAKLDSLSYRVTKDSPWEIAINDTELVLPHIIEVSLGFTPIGSQTRDKNEIPSKSPDNKISHIAQNWNATTDNAGEYISPASSSIYNLT
jgi:hypothetical protein